MAGLNKVTLIGNLGKDPEVRYTQGGTAITTLRIGVTERRKEADTWKDHTEWFSIVCFGKTAENAGKFLKKGRQIFVEGRLQTRQWQDKEGQTRYTTEVIAAQLLFLGSNRDSADTGFSGGGYGAEPVADSRSNFGGESEFASQGFVEEDIPF